MKCVICKSSDIRLQKIDEEVRTGEDIILIKFNVLICGDCGERYYDRKTMKKFEEIKYKIKNNDLEVEEVGKVLRARAAA